MEKEKIKNSKMFKSFEYSFLSKDDCVDIDNTLQEWLNEIKTNPDKAEKIQHKLSGAISILNKIDNIRLDIRRDRTGRVETINVNYSDIEANYFDAES